MWESDDMAVWGWNRLDHHTDVWMGSGGSTDDDLAISSSSGQESTRVEGGDIVDSIVILGLLDDSTRGQVDNSQETIITSSCKEGS